jgi:lipopolysaccharide transport system ATP-binding protein
MVDSAIRVENLGKRYLLGQQRGISDLREVLTEKVRSSFRALTSSSNGRSAPVQARQTIWALRNVSFEVQRSEVIGVIGDNGGGKTTLLSILSRITSPTEGSVQIRGRVGTLLDAGAGFHAELTGRENVYVKGAILGMAKAKIARNFDEIVAFAELEKFIDTPLKRYSSGMCVRLAFALAAHLESEVLLVDEVLATVDPAFQRKCLGKMAGASRLGRTVLFVSHDLESVRQLCSRCLILAGGRIIHDGPAARAVDLYESVSNGRSERERVWEEEPLQLYR